MCLVSEQLREAVRQRLAAAAEEIFELLERTISEYEKETQRQRHTLEQLLNTRGQSQGLKTEDPEPEPPHCEESGSDVITVQLYVKPEETAPSESEMEEEGSDVKTEEEETPPLPQDLPQACPETAAAQPPAGGAHLCLFCDKKYKWSYELKRHMRIHSDEAFSCSVCGKKFFRKDHLQTHMVVHSKAKPFSCSVCGLSTKTRSNLERHMSKHKSLKNNIPRCPEEGAVLSQTKHKSLKSPRGPEEGAVVSTGSRRVVSLRHFCAMCGKGFASVYHLRRHIPVHRDRPFSCSVCGISMKSNSSLERHMTKHQSGDRSSHLAGAEPAPSLSKREKRKKRCHFCVFCSKGFSCPSNLRRHIRVHTGEKPYRCSVCGQSFSRNYHLQTHMKIHSRRSSFSCSDCDKTFTNKQDLKNHQQLHTNQEPEGTSLIYCSID